MPEAVRRLLDKFDYPDRESPAQVIPILPTLGGGGGAPSVVVAADDAAALSKTKADYVCTGDNDQVPIQAAIDSLGSAGGRILLTEGNFGIRVPTGDGAIKLDDYHHLQGMGPESTFLVDLTASDPGAGSSMIQVGSAGNDVVISDLSYDHEYSAKGISIIASNRVWIHRVKLDQRGTGVSVYKERLGGLHMSQCYSVTGGVGADLIFVENGTDLWIVDNWLQGGRNAIRIEDLESSGILPHNIVIRGNTLWSQGEEAIYVDGNRGDTSYLRITDNFIQAAGNNLGSYQDTGAIHIIQDPAAVNDIQASGSEPTIFVHSNIIETTSLMDGIRLETTHQASIKDNHIEDIEGHGVYLGGSSGNEVAQNRIIWPADSPYDGIHLAGDSDHNFIHHNYIVNDAAATGWRWGINIADAGSYCNIVVGNVFGDYFTSGAINDGGTSTQLFYPNDVTIGDNFTLCVGS